jgi:hypothetical protein
MTEWLKPAQFNQLADSIWDLGKIAMRDLIRVAQPPALVKSSLQHGSVLLEPAYEIQHKGPLERFSRRPQQIELLISDSEAYIPDPSFVFYDTQILVLNTKERTHDFRREQAIIRGPEMITFLADEGALGKRRARGAANWRREQAEWTSELEQINVDFFVNTVHRFINLSLAHKLNQEEDQER